MVVEYIRYKVADNARGKELVDAYRTARVSLDTAPECLGYEFTVCQDDRTSFILRIEWKSTQDHLEGFRKGPNFPPFFKAIGAFVNEIAEMRHYELTDIRANK